MSLNESLNDFEEISKLKNIIIDKDKEIKGLKDQIEFLRHSNSKYESFLKGMNFDTYSILRT